MIKPAFMSSVWPAATIQQLVAAGREHGYAGIEFRPEWKHAHGAELGASAEIRRQIRDALRDGGLEACCLSPGIRFTQAEQWARDAEFQKLLPYSDLAHEMQIPVIRVFADPLPNSGGGKRATALRIHAEFYARAAEPAGKAGVRLAVETHTNCRGADVAEILYQTGYPAALWINWHLAHCMRNGEDLDEAYRHVKGRVAHVHFSIDENEDDLPLIARQYRLLADEGYEGYFSLEVINPPDPAAVLSRHAKLWRRITHANSSREQ